MLNKLNNINRLCFIVFLTSILFVPQTGAKEEADPVIWEGTVTVVNVDLGASSSTSGKVEYTWKMNVRWKEGERTDVKNRDGDLVGQFIHLEEDGSTWSSAGGGQMVSEVGSCRTTKIYSLEDSGSKILRKGWVYYSLSDEDPLADVLPNGAYHIVGDQGQFSHDVIDVTSVCSGSPHQHQMRSAAPLPLRLGRPNMWPHVGGTLIAEDIKPQVKGLVTPGTDVDMRFAADLKTMEGSYTARGYVNKKQSTSFQWNIQRQLEVGCTVEKIKREWRPVASSSSQPNTEKVHATVDRDKISEGKFKFYLKEISKEKGYAMNAGEGEKLDFSFVEGQPHFRPPEQNGDDWSIEGNETTDEVDVEIESDDYGAWAKLYAQVVSDGVWFDCESPDGKDYVTVPYDDNEDHVADYWKDKYPEAGDGAEADEDNSPPHGRESGDGLSMYEEYRGFEIKGVWQTTNPEKKDVFVHAADGLEAQLGYFKTATELTVHAIKSDEFNGIENRDINFNRGHGTLGLQRGIYIHYGDAAYYAGRDGVGGICWPNVGSPNMVQEVIIDYIKSVTDSHNLKRTVAHELGHALNIRHHGEWALVGTCEQWWSDDGFVLTDVEMAYKGLSTSGNADCVMRYDKAAYGLYKGHDGRCYPYPRGDVGGALLCSDAKGTGLNEGPERMVSYDSVQEIFQLSEYHPLIKIDGVQIALPVAGDAGNFGNCKSMITIKGEHTDGS